MKNKVSAYLPTGYDWGLVDGSICLALKEIWSGWAPRSVEGVVWMVTAGDDARDAATAAAVCQGG